ncbi:MAG: Fic family protein [Prevotellaceae bacterium]|jgi:Fic family protein|nr:Fic family protein [Prevotellaceae bacterium]
MNTIDKLLKEWLAVQPLKPELQRRMNQQFMFDFNYNSNHLEGNTLTYGQTKLLLLFGRVEGEALFRDYEEMKAHNVGLELMKREARDKQRPLSENFIRELNNTILAGDFYKTSRDGEYSYKIHTGVYKTRPNSVITPSGEMFDYASPEETPALMSDLVNWYRHIDAEVEPALTPIEQAALFHYRYIRIHPFEDGNGRIARLMMNYILLRNNYPMIVIPTTDRNNYLDSLGKCDKITGTIPYNGANATIEQIKPFVDYIRYFVGKKLSLVISFAKEEIREFSENDVVEKITDNQIYNAKLKEDVVDNVVEDIPENITAKRQKLILNFMKMNNKVSAKEIAAVLKFNTRTIQRDFRQLQNRGIIERVGGDRSGYWRIIQK